MRMSENDLGYTVTAAVPAPARFAFDFLADPANVGNWALGALNAKPLGGGVYAGASIADGEVVAFSVDTDARRLLVDYLVGGTPQDRVMRISSRVVPGEWLGRGPDACLVSMTAWRPLAQDELRWSRLRAFHDAEIHIVRERIARAWRQG
jgi:hypothetical protein